MATLPNTVSSNGQIIITQGPTPHTGFTQNINGSPLEAAAAKTLAAQQSAAAAAKTLGAGQKGAGKRRKSKKRKGGATPNMSVKVPALPEAGTIPGVSHEQNHINAINNLNQLRASAAYDSLINANPIKLGGFVLRDAESMYPGSGSQEDTKGRRKTKKKHGRRHKRTHRRGSRKSSHRRRGSRRRMV